MLVEETPDPPLAGFFFGPVGSREPRGQVVCWAGRIFSGEKDEPTRTMAGRIASTLMQYCWTAMSGRATFGGMPWEMKCEPHVKLIGGFHFPMLTRATGLSGYHMLTPNALAYQKWPFHKALGFGTFHLS